MFEDGLGPWRSMSVYLCTLYAPYSLLLISNKFWMANVKWHSPIGSMPFHRPKKLENSRAQPPPSSPRNGYARIQNIMRLYTGLYKS